MRAVRARAPGGVLPLLLLSGVVVLVVLGWGRGLWLDNLHNSLLALAFGGVGAYVLQQRPGHREGRLLLATGVLQAVMFLGRQVAHTASPEEGGWWAWLGVWPLAACLGLATWSVILFPDGRVPSRGWRPVLWGVATLSLALATISALWPVEYAATGVHSEPPFELAGAAGAQALWSAVAHPAYVVFQLL